MTPERHFAFRLALALGWHDVDAMLENMDAGTFLEWGLFAERYPWGEERADLRSGIIAATMANLWSKGRRWKPEDFMPLQPRGERRQTDEQMAAVFRAFATAHNAKVAQTQNG